MKKDTNHKPDIATLTALGARENNEDCLRVEITEDGALMALAADGLGGYEGGEKASQTVAEVCASCFRAYPKATEDNALHIIEAANDAVLELQKEQAGEMKTTLTLYLSSTEGAVLAHVGDTRGYVIEDGKIVYQTPDHSVAGQSVLMNELKASEIRTSKDRHRLLRTIGGDETVRPTIHVLPRRTAANRTILLCTDGFWEKVLEKEMLRTLRKTNDADAWLHAMEAILKKRMNERQDNYSALAVREGEYRTKKMIPAFVHRLLQTEETRWN